MQVFLLVIYDQSAVLGLAVLSVETDGKTARFLCATTADYCDFVSKPSDRHVVVAEALAELRRFGIRNLVLANLPNDSCSIPAVRNAAEEYDFHVFVRLCYRCAQVDLGSGPQRVQLKRDVDKKQMFRRNINFLQKEASVVLNHVRSWRDALDLLPAFCESHVARFLATGRISNLVRSERRKFLAELARRLSEAGWFVLSHLMVGTRSIAWNYGFQFEGRWFWYQPTFDSRLEHHSPGYCLLSKDGDRRLRRSRPMRVVDLGLGVEGYKERFANSARETLHITLTSSTVRAWLAPAARFVRQRPLRLYLGRRSLVRRWRSRAGSLRRRMLGRASVGFRSMGCETCACAFSHAAIRSNSTSGISYMRRPWREPRDGLSLRRLDLEALARAAISQRARHRDSRYLLRAAQRLRAVDHETLRVCPVGSRRYPVHLCWVVSV